MEFQLSPWILLSVIGSYFLLLMLVSYLTGRDSSNENFFTAKKQSPWILVAIGMIGASLSGVTFISIPGVVGAGGHNMAFSYMQMVLGYLVGYLVIAHILMPLYYSLNLTTIYGYLEKRLGFFSYKTGAMYFLICRVTQASFRLFLVAIVLQKFVMDSFGIPFYLTVGITIALIWVYTFRGGIKTIVWTDTLQTICMLTAVILTIIYISNSMDASIGDLIGIIRKSDYSQMFFFEGGWNDPNNFFKQFFSGALMAIVMTGLDQDMMQKNLTCRSLKAAQKNIYLFSVILIFANVLFLSLGALLYLYAGQNGIAIPERTDQLFPTLALQYFPSIVGVVFILGLIAAAYSSADSALTALTTTFCIDFLNFEKSAKTEKEKKRIRLIVHLAFSSLLFVVIILFNSLSKAAIINKLFEWAGYTYGPLLGLFAFGMFTKREIHDNWVISVCLLAPVLSYKINANSENWLGGFQFGFLILALNALLTFVGLWIISKPSK